MKILNIGNSIGNMATYTCIGILNLQLIMNNDEKL